MTTRTYNFETVAISQEEMQNTPADRLGNLLKNNIQTLQLKLQRSRHQINWYTTREAAVTLSGKTEIFVTFNVTEYSADDPEAFQFMYTQDQIDSAARENLMSARFNIERMKRHEYLHGTNYVAHTVAGFENSGRHFVSLALATYAKGDEMLGDMHARTAERYFLQAEILRGHISAS